MKKFLLVVVLMASLLNCGCIGLIMLMVWDRQHYKAQEKARLEQVEKEKQAQLEVEDPPDEEQEEPHD